MRVFILYRPNTEHERTVLEYVRDFKRMSDKEIELQSVDTIEGDQLAQVYDILKFPALVAVDSKGVMQKVWDDDQLPLMNEVLYYCQSE